MPEQLYHPDPHAARTGWPEARRKDASRVSPAAIASMSREELSKFLATRYGVAPVSRVEKLRTSIADGSYDATGRPLEVAVDRLLDEINHPGVVQAPAPVPAEPRGLVAAEEAGFDEAHDGERFDGLS